MRTKFCLTSIPIMVGVMLLTGCVFTFLGPVSLTNGVSEISHPALAIQADGTRHVIWQKTQIIGIGETTQVLYYRRSRLGGGEVEYTIQPPADFEYNSPDVAVTDSGYAYLVWRKTSRADSTVHYNCFDVIPPEGSAGVICQVLSDATSTAKTSDPPIVEARGEVVYAVYNVPYGTGGCRLRYRQLRVLDATGGWASPASDKRDFNYQAAIDSAGKLHVTWGRYMGATSDNYYNSSASLDAGGNMNRLRAISSSGEANLRIAVAGTAPEEVFAVRSNTDGHQVTIHHCGTVTCANPMTETILPLDPALFPYNGDLGVINNTLTVVFHAADTDTGSGNSEIYLYTYPSATLTRITNSSARDLYPQVEDGGNAPVMAWSSGSGINFEILVQDPINGTRRVGEIKDLTLFRDSDKLAAKNGWVAGIWLDQYSADDLTPTLWLSYNAHMVDLPQLIK